MSDIPFSVQPGCCKVSGGGGDGVTQEELDEALTLYTPLTSFNQAVNDIGAELDDKEEILTFTNNIITPFQSGKIERSGNTITYTVPDLSPYLTTDDASSTYATITELNTKEEQLNFGTALDEYSLGGILKRVGNNVIFVPINSSRIVYDTELELILQDYLTTAVASSTYLGNVNLGTLADNDTLKYDLASGKWINVAGGGGGGNPDITETNTDATYYPVFVDSSGSGKILRADTSTLPFSINPENGNFNVADTIKIDQGRVAVGKTAGLTNQGQEAVAIGKDAGKNDQKAFAISIGLWSGQVNQGQSAVAIGPSGGNVNQGARAVAIGAGAGASGTSTGQGANAVAIGLEAGNFNQAGSSVAVGSYSGYNGQLGNAVAIGNGAGFQSQKNNAIAIGESAGEQTQGLHSIAIGTLAGQFNQHNNSIVLNAGGTALNTSQASSFFVNPIRGANNPNGSNPPGSLWYNTTTKEICYNL